MAINVTFYQFEFLSTPSVGRATGGHQEQHSVLGISIHALRGEGDSDGKPLTRT